MIGGLMTTHIVMIVVIKHFLREELLTYNSLTANIHHHRSYQCLPSEEKFKKSWDDAFLTR